MTISQTALPFLLTVLLTAGCGKDRPAGDAGNSTGNSDGNSNGRPNSDTDPVIISNTVRSSGNWSDAKVWSSGTVPAAGDFILIPKKSEITLDVSTEALGGLVIDGELTVLEGKDVTITSGYIEVKGVFKAGTADKPLTSRLTIVLTGDDRQGSQPDGGNRTIFVTGNLELHGVSPQPTWTQLGANVDKEATSLELKESANWQPGEMLALAPSDFFEFGRTELREVLSSQGSQVKINEGLKQSHWGVLQYVSNSGMTLEKTAEVTETVVDQRAEVINLSRNILIQGADDSRWKDDGYGGGITLLRGAVAHIEGIEMQRVGQAGKMGHYPIHFHRMSYGDDGAELGDLEGQYVKNSSVWKSSQRCVVLHASNGVLIENNSCYDIRGHAFFLEDAVERRNRLVGNIALHIHSPKEEHRLLDHEKTAFLRGVSGFWLTNPDNIVTGNVAADSEGIGFWLAYPLKPQGLSKAVNLFPTHTQFGELRDAVAHSNAVLGFNLDFVPINDRGETQELKYTPTETEEPPTGNNEVTFEISGLQLYKNKKSVWNRAQKLTAKDSVISDFGGYGFAGSSTNCLITNNLVVGSTLNSANTHSTPSAGAASYHSSCDITRNTFVNLPFVAGKISGAFGTDDYYTKAVDKGLVRNVENVFISAHPGYRMLSPNQEQSDNWALAGALWDPVGLWGTANNFWVYDLPYFTDGTSCAATTPVNNGKSCKGPYFGVRRFRVNGSRDDLIPLRFTRVDNGAIWDIKDGKDAKKLGRMRHSAFLQGQTYSLRIDGRDINQITFAADNFMKADEKVFFGVPYTGTKPPKTIYARSWENDEVQSWESYSAWKAGDPDWKDKFRGKFWTPLLAANSLSEAKAANGDRYWHDTSKKLVWLNIVGGVLESSTSNAPPFSDPALYKTLYYRIDAQ